MIKQILGDSKPFTAVTDWIDRLCSPKYPEEDLEGIPELVEAINLQQTGPTEASRAIRKKLKYGNLHAQKRALTILRSLVENCNSRFQRTFADAMLVERIKIMSQDELVDASVRRKLMRVLYGWYKQFHGDPAMRSVANLYVACGGGRKSEQQLKSEAAEAYRKQREREEKERQVRSDYKAAKRLEEEERKKAKKAGKGRTQRRPFNFQEEKPQILASIASTQQYATALVNALQHVNRDKESVTTNPRVQEYLAKVKAERKKIVRYIQLVQDEEFVGSLISANDQIILALELYDKLAKPADVDSDEDEPLANISGASGKAARMEAEDAEIEAVRKRLLEARLMEQPEGELEKLQIRQRGRIQRHNSHRGGPRGGAMTDLMDINFDDDSRDHLPPSITPNAPSAHSRSGTSASAVSTGGAHGTLSDYSDYESEESDDDEVQVALASTSASGSKIASPTSGNKLGAPANAGTLNPGPSTDSLGAASVGTRGLSAYDSEGYDDLDDAASFSSRRPQIGPQYSTASLNTDEFDPFADPDEVPRIESSHRRETFAAV